MEQASARGEEEESDKKQGEGVELYDLSFARHVPLNL